MRPASTMRRRKRWVRSSWGSVNSSAGRRFLDDQAVLQEADPVGDVPGEAHLVRGDQHGHAAGGQFPDHVEHLGHQLRVERAGHLVEQHDLRLHRQRADDRDPLLLAAGEPVGVVVVLVGQAEPVQQLPRRAVASSCGVRSALTGASVTFLSTVMCGNRLKDWNTMPTWRRTRFASMPGAVMSWPTG